MMDKSGRTIGHADSGIIFAGHLNEPDSYAIERSSGMNDSLLFLTLEGEGFIRTLEGERRMQAGDFALLQSGVSHHYGTVRGQRWNFLWIHVPNLQLYRHVPAQELFVRRLSNPHVYKRVQRVFRNVLHDSREQSGLWDELCGNAVQEILLLIGDNEGRKLDLRVEQTLRNISRQMSEPLRVEELAAAVGLSESRLSHLFKEETGETIISAINRMRIQQAALYISHNSRTATQAALDVGFQNYNHFAALFRRQTGMSPSAYAKRRR